MHMIIDEKLKSINVFLNENATKMESLLYDILGIPEGHI